MKELVCSPSSLKDILIFSTLYKEKALNCQSKRGGFLLNFHQNKNSNWSFLISMRNAIDTITSQIHQPWPFAHTGLNIFAFTDSCIVQWRQYNLSTYKMGLILFENGLSWVTHFVTLVYLREATGRKKGFNLDIVQNSLWPPPHYFQTQWGTFFSESLLFTQKVTLNVWN